MFSLLSNINILRYIVGQSIKLQGLGSLLYKLTLHHLFDEFIITSAYSQIQP